jgi:alkaline phosphatase
MNRTRIKIGLTAVLTLLISVSQILADKDGAKDIIRLIGDRVGFSQVTATYVYETGHDGDLSAPLRY